MNMQDPVTVKIADLLKRAQRASLLSQGEVAERAGMSVFTLQKKLAGNAPINVDDLLKITAAIGVDPGPIIDAAMDDPAVHALYPPDTTHHNVTPLHPRDMTVEQLEAIQRRAANHDPEADDDEV